MVDGLTFNNYAPDIVWVNYIWTCLFVWKQSSSVTNICGKISGTIRGNIGGNISGSTDIYNICGNIICRGPNICGNIRSTIGGNSMKCVTES